MDIGCAPSGNARLNFHAGRLKLNLVTNLLAYDRATIRGKAGERGRGGGVASADRLIC